jgi:integrase
VDEDWVFTNQIGGPVDADDLTRNFRNLIKDTGLTQISLHGLRHTYASLMILAGVNAKEISDSLGHSSVAFTLDVYGHLYPAQRQDAADALDALMKPG